MGVKNCPETARQKMINMMYLVLLAMLALNVASEVLDAFRVVDSSLLQTYKNIDQKNGQIYSAFAQSYKLNQEKVRPWYEKAARVKVSVDSLIHKIYSIKEEIVTRGGGFNIAEQDHKIDADQSFIITEKKDTIVMKKDDDLNVPSEVMIRLKRGSELKEGINALREELLSMIDKEAPVRATIMQDLDTSDSRPKFSEGGEKKSWESERFEDKPMIAVIALLSKIQIDIENSESNILNYLYGQIDAGSFKFNKLGAVVMPVSSYVLEGDIYHAEVFLAAEDSTQEPVITVNGKMLPIKSGKGIYEVRASQPGLYSWSGEIHYKTPEGDMNVYPFKQQFQVSVPSVTVSPTKMNVFYLNIPNPISVSVPGVPSENLSVTVTNGRIEKHGNDYLVYPAREDINGKNTRVNVTASINGVTKDMGSSAFRVKRVPDPITTIADKNGGVLKKEDLLAEQGIFARMLDFDFDLKFIITRFDVTVTGSGGYNKTWSSKSNKFTSEQKQQFSKLPSGSIIYIDNIMAHGDDNTDRELSPVSFKIR